MRGDKGEKGNDGNMGKTGEKGDKGKCKCITQVVLYELLQLLLFHKFSTFPTNLVPRVFSLCSSDKSVREKTENPQYELTQLRHDSL